MLFLLFILVIVAGFFTSRSLAPDERKGVFLLFLSAFVLRVVLAVVLNRIALHTGETPYFLGTDDLAYGTRSIEIANLWREGIFPGPKEIHYSFKIGGFYWYYLALIMLVSNNNVFLPVLINCSLAGLSILLIYRLARLLFDRRTSFLSALFFAFWPSIVFWSSLNLKDALLVFLTVAIILPATKIIRNALLYRGAGADYILLFLPLSSMYLMQKRLFWVLSSVVLFFMFLSLARRLFSRRKAYMKALGVSLVVLLALASALFIRSGESSAIKGFLTNQLPDSMGEFFVNPVRAIDAIRTHKVYGGSAIMSGLHVRTVRDLVIFFPLSVVIAFFYPLPWHVPSLASLAAVPEMLVWYALLPFLIKGIFSSLIRAKHRRMPLLFIVTFISVYFLSLGLFEGNAGTLFRHRGLVLPLVFMFIAQGLPQKALPFTFLKKHIP